MRLASVLVVLAVTFAFVLSQTIPTDLQDTSDKSCVGLTGDSLALCQASSDVEVEDQNSVEPTAAEQAQIDADSQAEVTANFTSWFSLLAITCPVGQLTNASIALGLEIALDQARIAAAQANITSDIDAAVADWRAHFANFTAIASQFQPPAPEPAPRVKLLLFVNGFELMEERRMIEINILRVRLSFAIADITVNHLRATKMVLDYLVNTTCGTIDRPTVEAVILSLVRARRIFEFKAAKLAVLVQAFLTRHNAVMTALRARIAALDAATYAKVRDIIADWQARKDAVADTIRRAVIAYFDNVTSVNVTVTADAGGKPTVSITFDRVIQAGDVADRLKMFIARIIRTAIAAESGADESTSIDVTVSDPSAAVKRQAAQSYNVDSTINDNSSASAVALSALIAVAGVVAMLF